MAEAKALFLDRDGVINQRIVGGYVRTRSEFHIIGGVIPIMRMAHERGYLLIVISNQQGVGKGLMTLAELEDVHAYMQELLNRELGRGLDEIRVCTDLDSAKSPRRKPAPGMLLEAIAEYDIDPKCSWFLGDSITDAQAGMACGVNTALIGEFKSWEAQIVAPSHNIALEALNSVL